VSSPVALPPVLLPATLVTVGDAPQAEAPTATLDGPAAALAALAALGGITGTVASGSSAGALVLLTSLGTFPIESTSPLPVGAALTLRAQPDEPGLVTIVTINAAPAAAPTASPPPEAPPPTLIVLGTRLAAIVITAAPAPPLPEPPLPGLPLPALPLPAPPLPEPPLPLPTPAVPTNAAPTGTEAGASAAAGPAPRIAAPAIPEAPTTLPQSGSEGPPALPIVLRSAPQTVATPAGNPVTTPPAPPRVSAPPGAPPPGAVRPGVSTVFGAAAQSAPGRSSNPQPANAKGQAFPIAPPVPGRGGFAPGTSLVLRILALQSPATVNRPGTSALPPLPGIIRVVAPAGAISAGAIPAGAISARTIVETAAGPLRLEPAPALPAGTRVALSFLPGEPATVTLRAIGSEPPASAPAPPARGAAPVAAQPGSAPDGEFGAPPESAPSPLGSAGPVPSAPPDGSGGRSAPIAPAAARELPAAPQSPARGSAPATPPETPLYRVFAGDAGSRRVDAAPRTIIGTILADQAAESATASLVETPLGVLAVSPRLALPPGSLLLLELPDAPPFDLGTPDLGPTDPGIADRPPGRASAWSALGTALGTLGHVAPTLAGQLHAELSTQGGDKLAAAFLFLVATLRGTGPAAWPGEAVERALAVAGRQDIAKQLGDDLGELRRLAAAPATAPWQVFLLPVFDGAAVRPVRLYLKRPGERDTRGRSKDEDNARFVLEFELSRLGAVQLDGFVRHRRFDLALRSRAPLSPTLRASVTRIFRDRIAAAGLTGDIDFATVARFDIAPLDALRDRVGFAV
jgi:hypothetical protein